MSLVECLNCGETRRTQPDSLRLIHLGDCCPRCGYVGWAAAEEPVETARRGFRLRAVVRRRLVRPA